MIGIGVGNFPSWPCPYSNNACPAAPGTTVDVPFWVENMGDSPLAITEDITVSPSLVLQSVTPSSLTLPGYSGWQEVDVTVTIPAGTPPGAYPVSVVFEGGTGGSIDVATGATTNVDVS